MKYYEDNNFNIDGYITDRLGKKSRYHGSGTDMSKMTEGQSLENFFKKQARCSNANKLKLRKAIKNLSKKQQQALDLVYIQRRTEKEAAELLEISQPAISQMLNRAIKKLQKKLIKKVIKTPF